MILRKDFNSCFRRITNPAERVVSLNLEKMEQIKKIVTIFLLCVLSNNYVYTQTINNLNIDSVKITYVPFNVSGDFLYSVEELRICENIFKRKITLKEGVSEIFENINLNSDTIKKRNLVTWVIFDFYEGGEIKESVSMDCYGFIKLQSNLDICFLDLKLNKFFKELTNQEDVKCQFRW